MNIEEHTDQILGNIKDDLGKDWKNVSEVNKEGLQKTAKFAAKMMAREAAGEDVSRELIHLEAQVKNWKFVGSAAAKKAFWKTLLNIAEKVGSVLVNVAKRSLLGL